MIPYSDIGDQKLESGRSGTATDGERTRTSSKLLVSLSVLVAALYVGSVLYNHERVIPRGVDTVQEFCLRYGNPPRVDYLTIGDRHYYRIIADIPAPLGFPQGNPVYIFDVSGRLIDWTGESMADPSFRSRWDSVESQPMEVSYFLERFPSE